MRIKQIFALAFIGSSIIFSHSFYEHTVSVSAATETIDKYFQVEGTTLKKYTGNEENIVVPDGITVIGECAFEEVKDKIKTVSLPDSVVEIQECAFINTTLEKITFSKNVKKIGWRAFSGNKNLKEVSTLDGIEEIHINAFHDTPWLEEQKKKSSVIIFNDILYDARDYVGDLEIPNTVRKINDFAFHGNRELTSIKIPNTVISIGSNAFDGCYNLTKITIPDSVTKIGSGAFSFCINLKEIVLPKHLKIVEDSLFSACNKLTKVVIPDSVVEIGKDIFSGCDSLEILDIPKSVKKIDLGRMDCPWIEKKRKENSLVIVNGNLIDATKSRGAVKIPKGVTRISYDAFFNNKNVTSIVIPNTVTEIGESAFYYCTKIKTLTIPNSVKKMGGYVFYGCKKLEKIKLSNQLKILPHGAFERCKALKQITIPSSVTEIGSDPFSMCSSLKDIVVSSNVIKASAFEYEYPRDLIVHAPKGSYMEGVAKEAKVTFKPLAINKKLATIKRKETIQLHVGTDTTFTTWKSSNSSVASVNRSGKVTAKKKGTVTITGTLYGKKYICKIKVI